MTASSASLFLANRAEEGRASGLDDAANRAAAAARRARPSGAVVDAEIVLEIAELAIGAAMIAQRRAAGLDGVVEHVADGRDQRSRAGRRFSASRRHGRGLPPRR